MRLDRLHRAHPSLHHFGKYNGTRAAEYKGCNWGPSNNWLIAQKAVFGHTFRGIIWHMPQKYRQLNCMTLLKTQLHWRYSKLVPITSHYPTCIHYIQWPLGHYNGSTRQTLQIEASIYRIKIAIFLKYSVGIREKTSLELTILAKVVQIVDDGCVFLGRFHGHSVGSSRQSSAVVPARVPVW